MLLYSLQQSAKAQIELDECKGKFASLKEVIAEHGLDANSLFAQAGIEIDGPEVSQKKERESTRNSRRASTTSMVSAKHRWSSTTSSNSNLDNGLKFNLLVSCVCPVVQFTAAIS